MVRTWIYIQFLNFKQPNHEKKTKNDSSISKVSSFNSPTHTRKYQPFCQKSTTSKSTITQNIPKSPQPSAGRPPVRPRQSPRETWDAATRRSPWGWPSAARSWYLKRRPINKKMGNYYQVLLFRKQRRLVINSKNNSLPIPNFPRLKQRHNPKIQNTTIPLTSVPGLPTLLTLADGLEEGQKWGDSECRRHHGERTGGCVTDVPKEKSVEA